MSRKTVVFILPAVRTSNVAWHVGSEECSAQETLDAHPQVPNTHIPFSLSFFPDFLPAKQLACMMIMSSQMFQPPGKMTNMENVWQDLKHSIRFLCPSTALWIHVEGMEVKLQDNLWKLPDATSRHKFATFTYQMLPKGTVRIPHCVSGMVFLKTLVTLCRTSLRVHHTLSW